MLIEAIVCLIIGLLIITLVTPQYYESKVNYQKSKLALKIPWLPFVSQDFYKAQVEENRQRAVFYYIFKGFSFFLSILGLILLGIYLL